jgi:group II intron reverse transcriptase/maturase
VVKAHIEKEAERSFHADSYGYRRGRHAHHAIERASKRCWEYDWVIDLDIKSFFDTIDHEMMLKAVERYTKEKWVLMYIERWLKTGMLKEDGEVMKRDYGTPQGGVISPLLANIYLHFVFDKWMEQKYPYIAFERYCDDIIVHCKTERQARFIRDQIAQRLKACKLSLNEKKTHIVYCKDVRRKNEHDNVSFDFLGYTFAPRMCRIKGNNMLLFKPAMSTKSKKSVNGKLRGMTIHKSKENILQLAETINVKVRGWMNYYCAFDKWSTGGLWWQLNRKIIKWVMWNRKKTVRQSVKWLQGIYRTKPGLFAHWKIAHF